jgi:hypothetical protein
MNCEHAKYGPTQAQAAAKRRLNRREMENDDGEQNTADLSTQADHPNRSSKNLFFW